MKREQLAHFVDTSMASDTPTYVLLGDGIASLTENFNAETETTQWINQESGTTNIKSYTPSFDVERQDCIDDDCRDWIKSIIDDLPTGEEAQTYVVRVDKSSANTDGSYPAVRRLFAVSATSTGGDAGGYVVDAVSFGGAGDATKGTFDVDTLTFTAA